MSLNATLVIFFPSAISISARQIPSSRLLFQEAFVFLSETTFFLRDWTIVEDELGATCCPRGWGLDYSSTAGRFRQHRFWFRASARLFPADLSTAVGFPRFLANHPSVFCKYSIITSQFALHFPCSNCMFSTCWKSNPSLRYSSEASVNLWLVRTEKQSKEFVSKDGTIIYIIAFSFLLKGQELSAYSHRSRTNLLYQHPHLL